MKATHPNGLSFFNLSLKKACATESDSFKRARLRIILNVVAFAVAKLALVIPVAIRDHQGLQLLRALILFFSLLMLGKLVLWRPRLATAFSHVIIAGALVIVWSSLLIYVQALNVVTVQMIFIASLLSYYLIGGTWAAIYTSASILPLLYAMIFKSAGLHILNVPTQLLSSTTVNIVIVLNFLTFTRTHYLYYLAFKQTMREKDDLNEQLRKNVTTAEALAHSRSLFLSTMSHELRTPLNGVIGMTHLLRDSALPNQQDQLEQLEVLEFSANSLLAVVNDVLDYNKIELDRIELESLPVNLGFLTKRIAAGLDFQIREKGLTLDVEIDEILKQQQVACDPTRLTQILYNLLGNAIKFTNSGTVKLQARAVSTNADEVAVNFSISDTGIGIPAERLEAIFEPFVQASTTTTRQYGGTGLGLAIVKKLLLLLHSNIYVESRPGEGTTFRFTILMPWVKEDAISNLKGKNEQQNLQGLHILVAEDNRINVLLLEKLLAKWQVTWVIAGNGEEAVDIVKQQNFHLVLMDIHMPKLDGYDAAKAIRALTDPVKRAIPIIALTASASHDLMQKVNAAGMQDRLTKPFQPSQLYESLLRVYDPDISKSKVA